MRYPNGSPIVALSTWLLNPAPFSRGAIRVVRGVLVAAALAWSVSGMPGRAATVERFPRPEFESAYVQPKIITPSPREDWRDYVDMAALAAALAAASFLALRRRSRMGLVGLTIVCVAYFGFWRKGCVCPVGSVQNVVQALFDRSYAVPLVVLVFFLLPLVFALFTGRTFCAAVCPLGGMQDLVVYKPLRLPAWLSKALSLIPPVYLGLAVLYAACGAGFIICRWDPFVGFFRLSAPFHMLALGAGFLAVGAFIARPYCRFLCPYGVLLGWMSRLAWKHVTVTPTECIQCRLCEDVCPFDAILPATTDRLPVPRKRGVRRLAIELALLPIGIAIGVWLGLRIEPALARLHPDVALAEQVAIEDARGGQPQTEETKAFRASGTATTHLMADAEAVRRKLRIGSALLGALVGATVIGRLIGLSIARTRKDYVPDRGACVSCARCFTYCPKDKEWRKNKAQGKPDERS